MLVARSTLLGLAAVTVAVAAMAPSAATAAPSDGDQAASEVRGNAIIEEHSVALPSDGAIQPLYTSHPEGGGTWEHGTNGANNTAYSRFFHPTRKHGASVANGQGNLSRSPDTPGAHWANSTIRKSYAGNIAYYRFVK